MRSACIALFHTTKVASQLLCLLWPDAFWWKVKCHDPLWYERFVPSPSWLVKAWETTEDEMLAVAGLDAVVFIRMVIFSIRIFSIVAVVCIAFVLPVNYYGQKMEHKEVHLESLGIFTIENLNQRSRWLWVHCLSLYIISSSACALLYVRGKTKRGRIYGIGSVQFRDINPSEPVSASLTRNLDMEMRVSGLEDNFKTVNDNVKVLKEDIVDLKADLKSGMDSVKADLKSGMDSVKADLKAGIDSVKDLFGERRDVCNMSCTKCDLAIARD